MKKIFSVFIGSTFLFCLSCTLKAQDVYQIAWTDLNGVDVDTTALVKQSALGASWAGAASVNQLQPGVDGWFEFTTIKATASSDYYVGFSVENLDDYQTSIRHALRFTTNGQVHFHEGGTSRGIIGYHNIGDVFRIAREGSNIVFYRNGNELRSYVRENSLSLIADVSLYGQHAAIGNAVASFDAGPNEAPMTPIPVASVTPPAPVEGDFYAVNWVDKVGVEIDGSTVMKNVGTNWANAGAASSNVLPANQDGWFEFSVVTAMSLNNMAIGFSALNLDEHYVSIRHALFFKGNGQVYFYDSGASRGIIGYHNVGDRFRMAREANRIVIYQNGVELYSKVRESTNMPLKVDMAMYSQWAKVGAATASFGGENLDPIEVPLPVEVASAPDSVVGSFYAVDWTDTVGVSLNGSVLTKIEPSSNWANAGAASTNVLPAGQDGWFEFPVVSGMGGTDYVIGFSATNYDEHYVTIRHGLSLKGNGQVYYYDSGASRGIIGYFNVGDRFRMAREGSEIVIYQNGNEIYRRTRDNNLNFIIDLAMYRRYGKVGNVTASFGNMPLPPVEIPAGAPAGDGVWSYIPGSETDLYTTAGVAIQGAKLPDGYGLAVEGKIMAEGVTVREVDSWPDYVFKSEYQLRSLEEIKRFIDQYGHLPGMPSEQKVQKEGIELLKMNKLLLEKVEELTLHLIKQDEKLKAQEKEIEKLKKGVKE